MPQNLHTIVYVCLMCWFAIHFISPPTSLSFFSTSVYFRAEGLKDALSKPTPQEKPTSSNVKAPPPVRQYLPLGPDFSLHDKPQPVRAVQSSEPQGQRYTQEEIEVLR